MIFCAKCGKKLNDGTKFCPRCGTAVPGGTGGQTSSCEHTTYSSQAQTWEQFNQTKDFSETFQPEDIERNKAMAVLSYFSLLVFLPLLLAKESKYARFHANQGLILLFSMMGWQFASSMLNLIFDRFWWQYRFLLPLSGVVYLLFLVLFFIGIANALNGKAKELPLIGKFRILN